MRGCRFSFAGLKTTRSRAEEPPNPKWIRTGLRRFTRGWFGSGSTATTFPADGWDDFLLWYIGVHDEYQQRNLSSRSYTDRTRSRSP